MTARRLLLFQAAADLFTKYGYRKTSVEDITKAAGVSKGSLYLEFRSKEELFEALVRHEFGAYLEDAGERITADPEGGRLSGSTGTASKLFCTAPSSARSTPETSGFWPGYCANEVRNAIGRRCFSEHSSSTGCSRPG